MSTNNALISIIEEFCPGIDCSTCTTLVDDRLLDSLAMVALVAELEDSFDIEIPPVEIVASNFNSVEAIDALVCRLAQEDID